MLTRLVMLTVLLAISGCGEPSRSRTGPAVVPLTSGAVELRPSALVFPPTKLGLGTGLVAQIRNKSTSPVRLITVFVRPAGSAPGAGPSGGLGDVMFRVPPRQPITIAAGDTLAVPVTYAPRDIGVHEAELVFACDGHPTYALPISGVCFP